jgi:DNA replication protein DnaC
VKKPVVTEPPHLGADLKELKLPSVAAHWARLAEEAQRKRQPHAEYLADLVHAEINDRRERRIARLIQAAHFPVLKTLDGFDFGSQAALDREAVLDLADARFLAEHRNVVLMGEVGTGKTHLAIALGLAACQHEHRVRFATAAELANMLVEAKQAGRLARKLEQLARHELFVLDELGYVPFDKVGADLLFSFVSRVYERRSLIVTTNLPFARWNEVFLDNTAAAAVIDRVVHHALILKTEGESYRLKDAKRRAAKKARAS